MNRNLTGGYYLVSLDDVDLASESEIVLTDVAKLLYFAKKYKFVVFQDIVIDGEKKTAIPAMFEADMTLSTKPEDWNDETDGEFVPQELYTAKIYNLYSKNIEIDADGVASVEDYEVNPDTDSLYGKFVRILDADDIDVSALTSEQISLLESGVFINGTLNNIKNPIILPIFKNSASGDYQGFMLYTEYRTPGACRFNIRQINVTVNGVLTFGTSVFSYDMANFENYLFGKVFPTFPSSGTHTFKIIDGVLTWVEETA